MIKNVYWSSCKVPLLLSDFNKAWIFFTDCRHSNTKFHENSSRGSRVVPCGQRDMTKLTVAFSNFANAPKSKVYKMNNLKLEETVFRNTQMCYSKTKKKNKCSLAKRNLYFCVFLNLLVYPAQRYRHRTHAHTIFFLFLSILDLLLLPTSEK